MRICFSIHRSKLIPGIICAIISFSLCLFLFDSLLAGVFFATAFLFANLIDIHITCKVLNLAATVSIALVSSVFNFIFVQLCMDLLPEFSSIGQHGNFRYVLNVLCYLLVLSIFYGITLNIKTATLCSCLTTMILATINYYVVQFRGSELKPADIFSTQAALNVVGSYTFNLTPGTLYGWIAAAVWNVFLFRSVHLTQKPKGFPVRILALLTSTCCALTIVRNPQYINPDQWMNAGSVNNGFLLNYFTQIKSVKKPDGYNRFSFEDTETQYTHMDNASHKPHVIVIMNEVFVDLRTYNGTLHTDVPVTPFYDSLSENTIKGSALASIFGGGTANSEYEFLTGNTLGFLPAGAISYQQYVRDETYSLTQYMNKLGYRTVGMHPHGKTGWMRGTVWERLKFDETYFRDDGFFSLDNLNRGTWISDMEMYQKLLALFSENPTDLPLFLFGVTVQNHSGYTDEGYPSTVSLTGYDGHYPDVEQYLTLLRESDAALEYLITELEKMEEEVIVLFYGDHQARIDSGFYEELNGSSFDSLSSKQKQYTVPFFIWANYDIPESTVELTSLNFLSNYLLEAAEIPLPPYNQFLKDVEAEIPALNALGFYSPSAGSFLTYDEATGREKEILDTYQILQYNSIKGGKNRSSVFFP